MQRKSFHGFERGLSLIECCITLAIVSVLVGTVAPSFREAKQRHSLDGLAGELAMDLHFARSEAVARQDGVRFTSQAVADGNCILIHTGSNGDCQCSAGGLAQCSTGAQLVKSAFYPSGSGLNLSLNVSAIRFDPRNGMATPAGSVTVATSSGHALRHVVNMLGRVRTCSPGATSTSAKPC